MQFIDKAVKLLREENCFSKPSDAHVLQGKKWNFWIWSFDDAAVGVLENVSKKKKTRM